MERSVEIPKEKFITCRKCKGLYHELCALYSERVSARESFVCGECRGANGCQREKKVSAENLPVNFLSIFMEDHVRNSPILQGTNAKLNVGEILIRCVYSYDADLIIEGEMENRFPDYGKSVQRRVKGLLVFRVLDDEELLFFGMEVEEYRYETGPHAKMANVNYLDSIKLGISSEFRTHLYREILNSYFKYCQCEGFTSVYLQATPSEREYMFYCRPAYQRNPTTELLIKWYEGAFESGISSGCFSSYTTLVEHSEAANVSCLSQLPLFTLLYMEESIKEEWELLEAEGEEGEEEEEEEEAEEEEEEVEEEVKKRGEKRKKKRKKKKTEKKEDSEDSEEMESSEDSDDLESSEDSEDFDIWTVTEGSKSLQRSEDLVDAEVPEVLESNEDSEELDFAQKNKRLYKKYVDLYWHDNDTIFVLNVQPTCQRENVMMEADADREVLLSPHLKNADALVRFQCTNDLKFCDMRNALYSTKMLVNFLLKEADAAAKAAAEVAAFEDVKL